MINRFGRRVCITVDRWISFCSAQKLNNLNSTKMWVTNLWLQKCPYRVERECSDTRFKTVDYDLRTSLSTTSFDCKWQQPAIETEQKSSSHFSFFISIAKSDVNPSIKLHKALREKRRKGHDRQWEMMWINGLIKVLNYLCSVNEPVRA